MEPGDQGSINVRFLEPLRHIACLQAVYHFLNVPLDEAIETVQCQADAMVGHAILREVIGADLLLASPSSDETFAVGGVFFLFLAAACLQAAARA